MNYIEKLHIKNFRQFHQLDVEFNKKFNFIAGPNGCGKTSILAGLSHCFNFRSLNYSRFQEDSEAWADLMVFGEKRRIGFGSGGIQTQGYRKHPIRASITPDYEEGRKLYPTSLAATDLKEFCPLFIGADRSISYKKLQGQTREPNIEEQLENYTSKSGFSLHGEPQNNVKQWLINRYFIIDKDWAKEEQENWHHMMRSLPSLAPFNSNFTYVKTGRDLEPVFSLYGDECYLEELSAGFQAVLSIVIQIFEWIEAVNPEGKRIATTATGTVLIDELDLHLHPEWQFSLRDGLTNLFPNIQFIVTTHSPHVLSSAKENEIIIMNRNDDQREYSLKPRPEKYSGWNTDQILSDAMDVVSLENTEYKKLINKALDEIEKQDLNGLRNAIDEFSVIAHPNDSILAVLKIRYASLVAISDD